MAFDKYGARHKALRKGWARKVAAGGVLCARCGRTIEPGEPWVSHGQECPLGVFGGGGHRGGHEARIRDVHDAHDPRNYPGPA